MLCDLYKRLDLSEVQDTPRCVTLRAVWMVKMPATPARSFLSSIGSVYETASFAPILVDCKSLMAPQNRARPKLSLVRGELPKTAPTRDDGLRLLAEDESPPDGRRASPSHRRFILVGDARH